MPFVTPFVTPFVASFTGSPAASRTGRPMRRLLAAAALTCLAAIIAAAPASAQQPSTSDDGMRPVVPVAERPRPSAVFSPRQVVEIQLEALRRNDVPSADAGIATVFAFASPGNQEATGPIERFTALVKNPVYAPMLNHRRAELAAIEVAGGSASQRVRIETRSGQHVSYVFLLTRQAAGACRGCWLTDGVSRASADPDAPRSDGLRVTMRDPVATIAQRSR